MSILDMFKPKIVRKEIRSYSTFASSKFEIDRFDYATKTIMKMPTGHAFKIEITEYDTGECLVDISNSQGYGGYFTIESKIYPYFNCADIRELYKSVRDNYMNTTIDYSRSSALKSVEFYKSLEKKKPYEDKLSNCLKGE